MGDHQTFTKEQRYIIHKIKQTGTLASRFYFTGGTALSYIYLQHRHSEDLDFFSETRFDKEYILQTIQNWSAEGEFRIVDSQFREVVYIFNLEFKDKMPLKLDFGYYPYPRVAPGNEYEGIDVDSLQDIAINKLATINQRTAVKDFVDLYFLLKQFTIWDLIHGVRVKFNRDLERTLLASDFMKVHDFSQLPRMIAHITLDELKAFFTNLAKQLAQTVVEE